MRVMNGIRRAIAGGAVGASMLIVGQTAALADAPATAEPSWCQFWEVNVTIEPGGAATGHRYADMLIQNDSDNDCSVTTKVGLRLLDAEGNQLPTRAVYPSETPEPVTLEPFQTAVIPMEWVVVPTGDEPDDGPCQPEPAAVDVDLPGNAEPQPEWNVVDWTFGPVCNKGTLKLSPIKVKA
ncbi:DUF4232 domain-containing protein [Actinomadura miaoliensis]